MPNKLPTPIADTIDSLRRIGRFLDHVADTAPSDHTHAVARAHAIRAFTAIEHVEAMASIIDECISVLGDPSAMASAFERKH